MPGERARYFFSKILYARKSTLTRVCYNGDEKDYGEHMLSIAKFGKIALITGALLMIAALICLASFAEVGRGTSGAYAADGVADKVISDDVYTEDFVKIDTGLGVSAPSFDEDNIGSSTSGGDASVNADVNAADTVVSFRLDGRLLSAARAGRLSAEIYAVGTIGFTGTSEGAAGTRATYFLTQTFRTEGALNANNVFFNSSGDADSDPDDGVYDGAYSYSETYTLDNPLSVTGGYVYLGSSSDTVTLSYSAVFNMRRTQQGVVGTTVTANRNVDLDYYIAFDFQEVSVTVSLNNDSYGKIVSGDHAEVYDTYAAAVLAGETPVYDLFDDDTLKPVPGGSTITFGLKDDIAFTAIPAQNAIFEYWTPSSGGQMRTKTVNLGSAAEVQASAGNPTYTARFRTFPVSTAAYTYNGSPQGPTVSDNTVTGSYALERLYYGAQYSGAAYSGDGLPTYAGEYTFAVAARYGSDTSGEFAGAALQTFTLARRPVSLSFGEGGSAYSVQFGQTLSDIGIDVSVTGYDAGQSVSGAASFNFYDAETQTAGSVADPDSVKVLGELDHTYTFAYLFTPDNATGTGTDAYNYAANYVLFTVDVVNGFNIGGVGTGAGEGGTFEYHADVTRDEATGAETIYLTLTATLTGDATKWFFMGWRLGEGEYLTAGAEGTTYVHEVAVDSSPENLHMQELGYTFTAVFTGENVSSSIASLNYTGSTSSKISQQTILASMSAGSRYGTEIKNLRYSPEGGSVDDAYTSQPVAVGRYILYFDVYNTLYDPKDTLQSYLIGTASVPFEIVVSAIGVGINTNISMGYNYDQNTGWSNRMRYNLTSGLQNSADTKYYYFYKINGAAEWLNGGSLGNAGSVTYFDTPLMYGDVDLSAVSAVVEYIFVAVNDSDGSVVTDDSGVTMYDGLKVVSVSGSVKAKLDNFAPVIGSVTPVSGSDTAAWARYHSFEISVTYGGSGVLFGYYTTGDSVNSAQWLDSAYSTDGGVYGTDSGERTEPVTATFIVDVRFSFEGYMTFAARNGTKLVDTSDYADLICIDAENPVIAVDSVDDGGDYSPDGWYGSAVTVHITVTDPGGSGAGELTVQDDGLGNVGITVTSLGGGAYTLVVSEPREYVLAVKDGAANVTYERISYNVETESPTAEYAPGSVVGGGWIGGDAVVEFIVSSADGVFNAPAKLSFRTAGSESWADATGFVEAVNGVVTLSYGGVVEGVDYEFKVTGANGKESAVLPFAKVGFDSSAPVTVVETDLTPYQGSEWTSERVGVRIRVTDIGNAGIPWNDPEYVNGVYVENRPSAEIVSEGEGIYIVYVEDCTEYVVIARDRAGNSASVSFTLNVDQVAPGLEVGANIGSATGEEYVFGEWITDGSAVVVTFTFELTASGTKVQYSTRNNTNWIDITDTLYPEAGNYTGVGTAEWTLENERQTDYRFRVVTGSGRTFEAQGSGDGYYKIYQDHTAPVVSAENFILGNDFDYPIETEWTAERVTWRFLPGDSVSGVDEIKIYKLPADTAEQDVESMLLTENEVTPTLSGGYYIYVFEEYAMYVLRITDVAGNVYMRTPLIALTDFTAGFAAEATATLNAADGAELVSGTPLENASDVAFFTIAVSGIEAFGPSGARAEYSVDGETWNSVEGYDSFTSSPTLFLAIGFDGVYTLSLRVVTGAGNYAPVSFGGGESFDYVKDTAEISVSIQASTSDAEGVLAPYTGVWTNLDVVVTVGVSAGASGGTLYVSGVASGEYAVPMNSVVFETELVLSSTVQGELNVTYVSNRNSETVSDSIVIAIDKEIPEISVSASGGGGEIASGGYGYGDIYVKADINQLISGIDVVEVSVDGGEWETLSSDGGYAYLWADGTTGDSRTFVFRAVSGAGSESVTEPFTVTRDETEAPDAAPEATGTLSDDGKWYLDFDFDLDGESDGLTIGYTFDSLPVSGLVFEYSYTVNGESVTGSVSADVNGRVELILYDRSAGSAEKGGTVYENFSYAWVTGAGKRTSSVGGGTAYSVDGNMYTVALKASVADKEETLVTESEGRFVTALTGFGAYYRGVTVSYSLSAAENYRFMSFKAGEIFESYEASSEYATSKKSGDYTVDGDFEVSVEMYREVAYTFLNLVQHLQTTGIVTAPVMEYPAEIAESFADAFVPVTDIPDVSASDPYGVYTVTASFVGGYADSFVFVSAGGDGTVSAVVNAQMRITYFTGSGTESDPYCVYDAEDFAMISSYMRTYSDQSEEERFNLAFGAGRKSAYFTQNADFEINNSFVAVEIFSGTYDGLNHVISAENLTARSGGFGIFKALSGASVKNLGVTIGSLTLSAADGAGASFLTEEAEGSDVRYVFVIGNVYVSGADNFVFGGIAAEMTTTLIYSCFSSVNVFADAVTGYVGGLVGRMTDTAYTSVSYAIGSITADGCKPYSVSGTGDYLYAGTVAGYAENVGVGPGEANKTYYINKAVSYGGANVSERSLGNYDYANYQTLSHAAIEGIEGFLDFSDVYVSGKSVAELVVYAAEIYASRYGVTGSGTPLNPFRISEADDLSLIAEVPWGYFEQTASIAPGEYVYKLSETPFRGSYDGKDYALNDIEMKGEGAYLGVFRVLEGTVRNLKFVNFGADFDLTDGGYAGAVAAVVESGASLVNVVATGTLNVVSGAGTSYVGAIGGVIAGIATDVITNVSVFVEVYDGVAGSVFGQIRDAASVSFIAAIGSLNAEYSGRINIGAFAGESVLNASGSVTDSVYLTGRAYAGGYAVERAFRGNGSVAGESSYQSITSSAAYNSSGRTIGSIIEGLYPFEGSGTQEDPFIIENYTQLRGMSSYMYANFELRADITVGDYDGDGRADEADYVFTPIGGSSAFTGTLNGNGYRILGLTDSLFTEVSGTVRKLGLTMDCAIETSVDLTFGAVAKKLLPGAQLVQIGVSGEIAITATDGAGVIAGAIAGSVSGGRIRVATVSVRFKVRGANVVYGGIAGELQSIDFADAETWTLDGVTEADIGAATVNAGKYIGINRASGYDWTFKSDTSSLIVNGTDSVKNVGKDLA